MKKARRNCKANPGKNGTAFAQTGDLVAIPRVVAGTVRCVGEQVGRSKQGYWEGLSLDGDHVWSRSDLHATGLLVQSLAEMIPREGLDCEFSLDNEEIPLAPLRPSRGRSLVFIADPIDGSKAFDNCRIGADVPLPEPGSAVSWSLNDLVVVVIGVGEHGRTRRGPDKRHRTAGARSSGPSGGRLAMAARAAAAFWAAGVSGGTRPSGGSTTSEVRRVGTTLVPRSNQNSL
jgi:hypothetical protein